MPWQFCVIIKSLWSNMLRIRGKRCCRRSCWYPRKDTYLLDQVRFAYCVCRKSCVCVLVAQSCLTLGDPMGCSPPGSLCPWNSPGKNTGVGFHFLLQGIFLTQGSNPGVPHCRTDSLPSEPPGKPIEKCA